MSRRPLVVVTQPYVPAYRVPLFQAIRDGLSKKNIDLVVAAGSAGGVQALRGDETLPAWAVPLKGTAIMIGGRRVVWRRLPTGMRPDLLVSELEALNSFAWKTIPTRTRLVMWGHGKPYVNEVPWFAERLEWVLARRADSVMTYTQGGRNYLIEKGGINPSAVHAIGNSTDSAALRAAFTSVDTKRVQQLREQFGAGPRALFIGGLDSSKRISFLLDAALAAQHIDPRFKLMIVGRGELEPQVRALSDKGGPVIHVLQARGTQLAELGHIASAVWMPGRVGLVAVDSLALGLPVCTTDFAYHAPEIEFLRGAEVRILTDRPDAFGRDGLKVVLENPDPQRRLLRDDIPTIAGVAGKFINVVLGTLS